MQHKFKLMQQENCKAEPSRTNVKCEKQKQELQGHGYQLEEKFIQGMEKISITSPEEAFELAAKHGVPESDVQPHLLGIEALVEHACLSMDEGGLVKDPHIDMPLEEVCKSFLTPEMEAEINARIDTRIAKKK